MQTIAQGNGYSVVYSLNDDRAGEYPYLVYVTGGEGVCRLKDREFALAITTGEVERGDDGKFDWVD